MESQTVYLIIDVDFFLYVQILSRNICLRLVEIVCRDEVCYCILRKEVLEFSVKLRRECLVVTEDEDRFLDFLDKLRHCKSLTRARNTLKCLSHVAFKITVIELLDSFPLVTGEPEWGMHTKRAFNSCNIIRNSYLTIHCVFSSVCSTSSTPSRTFSSPLRMTVTSTLSPALVEKRNAK